MPDFTKLFLKAVKDNEDFQEAIDIIRRNSQKDSWLIGGFVYRNIASSLYGTEKAKADLDFIIEKSPDKILVPRYWKKRLNKYGNPKLFRNDGLEIDFVPLENVSSILRRHLKPSIENFLTGTPLTIQSIAYDIKNNCTQGNIGIKALLDKTVAVNDFEQMKIYSQQFLYNKNKDNKRWGKDGEKIYYFNYCWGNHYLIWHWSRQLLFG